VALWLVRAGSSGEYEKKFLDENRIYLTWDDLDVNLQEASTKDDVIRILDTTYPNGKPARNRNWANQIWAFAKDMEVGDWVVMPSKMKSLLHFGEIKGEYVHDSRQGSPYFHHRKVKWFAKDIPRTNFDQDILYSLGAFLTVCRISRNDAEARIKAMAQNAWKSPVTPLDTTAISDDDGEVDLELMANDTIVRYIGRKFKGHGMARLVEAILKAKGYATYMSPEGPDKGIDILAAPEPLGFGRPRICVQVKTTDTPVDRPTLDQLIGVMQNSNAEQGLLVSWSGFKSSVHREIPTQFFRVRLWDQTAIIDELIACYDRLDEDIRAEIPLKRIWTLALPQDG